MDRLGIGLDQEQVFDFYPLSTKLFLPAACQGIIAVEAVQGSEAAKICRKMTDLETELCYLIEREVLRQLSADCSEAVAAWCRTAPCVTDRLLLDVMYAGNRVSLTCPASVEEGRQLAWQAAQMVKGA